MDMQTIVGRELLRAEVSRKIFCQMSGRVLDVKTAMLAEISFDSGNIAYIVVDHREWHQIEPGIEKLRADANVTSVATYDGRELFGRK